MAGKHEGAPLRRRTRQRAFVNEGRLIQIFVFFLLSNSLAFAARPIVACRVDWTAQVQVCTLTGGCYYRSQRVALYRGSAVVLSQNTSALAVLTAAHNILQHGRRQRRDAVRHVLFYIEGQWRPGAILGEDRRLDLAIFSVAISFPARHLAFLAVVVWVRSWLGLAMVSE